LSLELNLIGLLDLGLLVDLSVDSGLEVLDLFLLDEKLLLLLEGLNLLLDDLNFLLLFLGLLLLGVDNDLSNCDLLLDLFLLNGNLLKSLGSEGQFSSGSGLLNNDFLSLSGHGFNILLGGRDFGSNLVNLLLNLRFLTDRKDLVLSLELLSSRDESVNLSGLLVNLLLNFSDLLGSFLDGGLQLGGLRRKGLNLSGDRSLLILKIGLLFLNYLGELLLSFLGRFIDFLASIIRFFFLFLDFSNDGLLGLLDLFLDVGNLVLHNSSLLSDHLLLIFLSLNLLFNNIDLLLGFLGDSGSLGLDELSLVDLLNLLSINILGLFLSNYALSLFLKNLLFLFLLFFDGGLLNGYLSDNFGSLLFQVSAHLEILLLLCRVLRLLSLGAGALTLNFLLFSNNLLVLVDLLKLGELLGDHGPSLRDLSGKSLLGISRAFRVADLARSRNNICGSVLLLDGLGVGLLDGLGLSN